MAPTYDFLCSEGHSTESRQGYGVTTIPCRCGVEATRQSVYRQAHIGLAPLPRDEQPSVSGRRLRLFQEASQERDYAYSKIEREIGHSIEAPNLYRQGIARAKVIKDGKAPPVKGTA